MTSIHDRDGTEPREPKGKNQSSIELRKQFEVLFELRLKARLTKRKFVWANTEIRQFRNYLFPHNPDVVNEEAARTVLELRHKTPQGYTGNPFEEAFDELVESPEYRRFAQLVLHTHHA